MLRWLKIGLLSLLGLCLLSIALANRDPVTLVLMHTELSAFAGFNSSITLPLYMIVFGSIVVGLLIGFVWEWFREHKHRAEASKQRSEARQLKREVETMKSKKAKEEGKDDVIALLEDAG